jgi:cation diffusion facilitator CzcD-associated flavoprotein CzcO
VTSDSTDTSVVVIGGGQAGLSVSYYLKRLGLDPGNEFVVLDRGPGSGGAWQFRWDALRIGSAHRINDLPGMDAIGRSFETADRHRPAKDVVAEYYEEYERHFGFQVVRPAAVTRVENAGDRMIVTFSDGQGLQTVSTDVVINATGTWGSPFIPWYPGRDSFAGRHVHTAEYTDAAEFAGKRVVVVGGGTSAIGFLLELEPVAAETTWVSRRPIEFLEDGELNLEARASAVALQDEAARAGRALPSIVSGTGVPRTRRIQAGIDRGVLTARPMFSRIEPGGVRWSNGAFQEADVIIWSTGFRPELRHLAALKLREKEGGIIVANGTSWKEPRIFFAGYGPQASTIGANRAGRTVARQAIATLSRLKRQEREAEEQRLAADGVQPFSFDFAPAAVPTAGATSHAAEPVTDASASDTGEHVLTEDVLARMVVAEPQTESAPSEDSQEDIDLSWMMPSDEPMEPLDFLPVSEDGIVHGAQHPAEAPEVHVQYEAAPVPSADDSTAPLADEHVPAELVEPAVAAQFGFSFVPPAPADDEADSAPREHTPEHSAEVEPELELDAETPVDPEPVPEMEIEPEPERDVEPEPEPEPGPETVVEDEPQATSPADDGTPTVAFTIDSSWSLSESDPETAVEPEPEPAVLEEPEPATTLLPAVEPGPQPVAAPAPEPEPAIQLTRFAFLARAEALAFDEQRPVVPAVVQPVPVVEPAPTVAFEFDASPWTEPAAPATQAHEEHPAEPVNPTRPVPVLTMEELFAPVLEPEEPEAPQPPATPWSDPAQWSAPRQTAEPDAPDAPPTPSSGIDVEPEYDDEDPVRPASSRPPRRELPDFDELLKPRDDD